MQNVEIQTENSLINSIDRSNKEILGDLCFTPHTMRQNANKPTKDMILCIFFFFFFCIYIIQFLH